MIHHLLAIIFDAIRNHLADHGYLTVAIALLLENAGLPVPGETVLLLASFLAYSEHRLHLPYIIVIGIVAASLGDNIGYAIGRRGGRPLLDRYRHWFRIPDRVVERGEHLFEHYGPATIFFARFIFGLRVIAGPLAGVLRMPWARFAIFNVLGAMVWVSMIATLGYLFGSHWEVLLLLLKRVNTAVLVVAGAAILFFWWRRIRAR